MRKAGHVLVVLSFFIFLCGSVKSSFAFECVGPEDSNCQQCHTRADLHEHHAFDDCILCHCGVDGVSNCNTPPYMPPVEAVCCSTCHDPCFEQNMHTLDVARGIDCTVSGCHDTTPIGIDDDCDGTCNPGETGSCTGSDNCQLTPNGPNTGTCTSGTIATDFSKIGANCTSDTDCGDGGSCSINQDDADLDTVGDVCDNCPDDANAGQENDDGDMLGNVCDNCPAHSNPGQEDSYPPQGNDIGDACDCEGDFDCSGGVDAADVDEFLLHFGRTTFFHPCTNADPCNGDFNCDVNVDATDVTIFLEDFGRGPFFNPCPACTPITWCSYP